MNRIEVLKKVMKDGILILHEEPCSWSLFQRKVLSSEPVAAGRKSQVDLATGGCLFKARTNALSQHGRLLSTQLATFVTIREKSNRFVLRSFLNPFGYWGDAVSLQPKLTACWRTEEGQDDYIACRPQMKLRENMSRSRKFLSVFIIFISFGHRPLWRTH
ncbi:hypothetical protein R1flu_004036 [Riccia fluitans]|uniref:Uncharacterized protein n=1 Tax=Riccia fluitans TaxID=41844 RepID=A0ABD1YT33_9MARC